MKKSILLILAIFCMTFSGCMPNDSSGHSQPAAATPENITQWPVNEYTSQVFQPESGEVDYIIDDSANGHFSVFLKNFPQTDAARYIEELEKLGYQLVQSAKNEVSNGILLKKDSTIVSIAYSGNVIGIHITLEK